MTAFEFTALVQRYQGLVYTICHQLVPDPEEAQDLAQETFLAAWRAADRCPAGYERQWLARIAANKAREWFEMKNKAENHPVPPAENPPKSLFVKTEYRLQQIPLDSILYIEGLKDYVKIHIEGESHPILSLMSLKSLEEQLPGDRFIRVHRSFIVQPAKIRTIERNRIVFGKNYIPISENYRQAFFDFLSDHALLF